MPTDAILPAQPPDRAPFVTAARVTTVLVSHDGVAWLPRTLVEEDLQAGTLIAAADADWNVDLEIRLYRQHDGVGRAADAFWEASLTSNTARGG
jgi:DNA-binding transcriptional LysR family regulator